MHVIMQKFFLFYSILLILRRCITPASDYDCWPLHDGSFLLLLLFFLSFAFYHMFGKLIAGVTQSLLFQMPFMGTNTFAWERCWDAESWRRSGQQFCEGIYHSYQESVTFWNLLHSSASLYSLTRFSKLLMLGETQHFHDTSTPVHVLFLGCWFDAEFNLYIIYRPNTIWSINILTAFGTSFHWVLS